MKKAFTLIELMITILMTTIFLHFVFRFYSNVLMEVRYLEAKDSLTYNAFRAMQIVKNGVQGSDDYIGGVITLKNQNTTIDNNFTTFDNSKSVKIDTDDSTLTMLSGSNSYKFHRIDILPNNFTLKHIDNNLYIIEFNATQESLLRFSNLNETNITYQRLVYTR